jgi:hypothetical protein
MRLLALALLTAPLFAQAVEGRVTNSVTGVPIPDAPIEFRQGGVAFAATKSDPTGAYRIETLAPAIYTVVCRPAGFVALSQPVTVDSAPFHFDLKLVPFSTVSGRVLDPVGNPVPKAAVLLMRLGIVNGHDETADAKGEFIIRNVEPGAYRLSARPPKNFPAPDSDDGRPRTWTRTYFPGTERPESATSLNILSGADLYGQDIPLRPVPARRIRGRVLDPAGDPVPAAKLILNPDGELMLKDVHLETHTDENGVFQFPAIHDGGWKVEVESENPKTAADLRLNVVADVDRLDIRLRPTFSITGTLQREPASAPRPGNVGVVLIPPGSGSHFFHSAVDGAGGFHMDAVTEGAYTVRVMPVDPPFYLASIRLGEREILGEIVEITSGAVPLTVTIRTDGGTVRGSVDDCAGGSVVLVPQNTPALDFSRTAKCRAGGAFEIGVLRPGEYYAYAFANPPGPLEYGPLTMSPTTNQAVRVTVRANEATQINLKLTPR